MKRKLYRSFLGSIWSMVLGILMLIIGFNGETIGTIISKPLNASSWETSSELINAFVFIPIIIGFLFLVLSIVMFSISLNNWQRQDFT